MLNVLSEIRWGVEESPQKSCLQKLKGITVYAATLLTCMLNTGKLFPLVCHRKLMLWDRLMIYLKAFLQQPARSSP